MVIAHLQRSFHELDVMLEAILDALEATLVCTLHPAASVLDHDRFWAHVSTATCRHHTQIEASLDIVADWALSASEAGPRKLLLSEN